MTDRKFLSLAGAVVALLIAVPGQAQILKQIQDKVSKVKEQVDDARALRCDVQGVCGEVWSSDQFTPDAYETLAVAVFDATRRYRSEDMQVIARDPFEGGLIEKGFMLAGSTEAARIQQRIGGGTEEWTDERLAQLRDFVSGIDGVLIIDIKQFQQSACTLEKDKRKVRGMNISVSLSARWLSTDVGQVMWIANHKVSVCEDGGPTALAAALETAATQLATNLPARSRP